MKKIVVGISGGVDSAVSVYKLLEEGYKVTGVHIKSWDSFANSDKEGMVSDCQQGRDYEDAKRVADHFNVDLITIDFVKEYWKSVFNPALDFLKKGLTPNPDNFCNKHIKFGYLKKYIEENFPNYCFATGHYASLETRNKQAELIKAIDVNKDQTYFLSRVEYNMFENVIFPLGKLQKREVRDLAKIKKLHNFDKKDSTGLCFVGERNYEDFLANYLDLNEGKIVNFDTKEIIGKHKGYYFYTIGQNKNLNLGGQKERMAIYKKNIKENILYVLPINDERHFYSKLEIGSFNIIGKEDNEILKNKDLTVKIRHQGREIKCNLIEEKNKSLSFNLEEKTKSITPGQEAVFYINDRCIGGGTISNYW